MTVDVTGQWPVTVWGVSMCHLIILAALLSLASGQTSDCYDQNVRYNGDSLTVTKAK